VTLTVMHSDWVIPQFGTSGITSALIRDCG